MADYDPHVDTYQDWAVDENLYRNLEQYTFLQVVGSVRGLSVLDLATGEGRMARLMIEQGATTVVGGDISSNMVTRATEKNTGANGEPVYPDLRFIVLDARDDTFRLPQPVDLVIAMYLLHYAPSEGDLERMAQLIARNLKPGGRFVTFTVNPDYNLARHDLRLWERFGYTTRAVNPPQYELVIGDMCVPIWQWSRKAHEACLTRAGLGEIRWQPPQLPPDMSAMATELAFYLDDPECIVLSARKFDRLGA